MIRALTRAALALAGVLMAFGARADQPLPFTQFRLENGLEVIVLPNHRLPAVNHTLWFRVGATDDPPGKSGLAHYLEHMMFQGTKAVPAGDYSKRIAALGGKQNAFTTRDYTGYYVTVAKEHLPEIMKLEADRLQNLMPKAPLFAREREVILEERRSSLEAKPASLLAEQMDAALYLNHPYGTTIIGWREEMEGLTAEDAMGFYRHWYHPANALLTLSGDITAAEAKKLAQRHYGKLPKHGQPEHIRWREPAHAAVRSLEMHHPNASSPRWSRYYLAPSLGTSPAEKVLPVFFLNQLLGGGQAGRLYRSLVAEQKLVSDINVDYSGLLRGPGKFLVSAVLNDAGGKEKLEAALAAELERLRKEGITDAEMERIRITMKAEMVYAREGLQPIGNIMGTLRMVGLPPEFFNEWPALVDRVTKEQVLAAARDLFVTQRSVTGLLLPETVQTGKAAHAR